MNLTRKNKPVSLRKTCPKCNSKKFKALQFPRKMGSFLITNECLKEGCGYQYGVSNGNDGVSV